MKQKLKALAKRPDPPAAALGAVLAIAGVFHVSEKLGITGDELGIVLGSALTIAASVRARLQHKAEARA